MFLRNISLFEGVSSKELAAVAGIAEEVALPARARIVSEGDDGDAMFLIVQGNVRVSRRGKELAILHSKDYFGEMSILDGEPRSATVESTTECHLLRIRQSDFHEILKRNLETSLAIIKVLCRRLRTELGRPRFEVPVVGR